MKMQKWQIWMKIFEPDINNTFGRNNNVERTF